MLEFGSQISATSKGTIEDHPTAPPGRATGLPIQPITTQNTLSEAADKENAVEPVEAE
jgi:hypothetical protein